MFVFIDYLSTKNRQIIGVSATFISFIDILNLPMSLLTLNNI